MSKVLLSIAAAIAMSLAPPPAGSAAAQRTTPAATAASRALANTKLTMTVPAQGLPAESDATKAAVISERVQVSRASDLSGLLTARGVEPTPEAIGAIYDLNPTLDDIRNIKPGTTLALPKLTGDPALRAAISRGYKIHVANEATPIKSVTATNIRLGVLSERISSVGVERFRVAADRERFVRSFTTARSLIDRTLNAHLPLAQKVLRQTGVNAAILENAARLALGSGDVESPGPFADDGIDQIDTATANRVDEANRSQQAIYDDLSQGGSALGLVRVITVDSASTTVSGLRVTYAPKLDPSDVQNFIGITSPASETLVVGADYTLTVPGGDTALTIRVRKTNQPITFKIIRP